MSSTNPAPTLVSTAAIRLHYQRQASSKVCQIWQNCLNCVNWSDGQTYDNIPKGCMHYKAMPPPEVLVNGCEKHEFDIPF